jgi:hypothetical protein
MGLSIWDLRKYFQICFYEIAYKQIHPDLTLETKISLQDIRRGNEDCAICKGSFFLDGDEGCLPSHTVKLSCGHIFGLNCVSLSLNDVDAMERICLLCRQSLAKKLFMQIKDNCNRGVLAGLARNSLFYGDFKQNGYKRFLT